MPNKLPSVGPNFRTENAYVRGLAGGAFSIRPDGWTDGWTDEWLVLKVS